MLKGGHFLLENQNECEVFTPEDFTDEQRMIASMTSNFAEKEVAVHNTELEEMKPGLMRELLHKAGELGLVCVEVPEKYGGQDLDMVSSCLINESLAVNGSFLSAYSTQVGIGSAPIMYFGNEDQKVKYLPGLTTGEKIGAYALTEAGAGSDALAIKTKATLSEDGCYYLLNGSKQFITNAGIADVFITYAKVDGDKFTTFIVDKDTEGFYIGPEEKKMGLKGTSTCCLTFDNAKVPVENVLFEIGKGHIVAFNVLNLGRFKLGALSLGTAKMALKHAAKYAQEREQFGQPIGMFGMIQEKLGRMVTAIYIAESVVYRTAGLIEQDLKGVEEGSYETIKYFEEYAVECSINKVFASEVCNMVTDETVQIFGGYGYSQEYPAEQLYRDCRINRIFEGTNEINRIIIPNTLLRRANKEQFPLISAAKQLAKAVLNTTCLSENEDGPLSAQQKVVEAAKKVFLMVVDTALQKYKGKLEREQEILRILADLAIQIYAMESGLLRAMKSLQRDGLDQAEQKVDMVQSYINELVQKIEGLGRDAFAAMETGDELINRLEMLQELFCYTPVNGISANRRIACRVLKAGCYTA